MMLILSFTQRPLRAVVTLIYTIILQLVSRFTPDADVGPRREVEMPAYMGLPTDSSANNRSCGTAEITPALYATTSA